MIDNLDDMGIPIVALYIVKNAVAPNHQVIGIAASERRGNDHFLGAVAAFALAIGQIGPAQIGHGAVGVDAINLDAELTGAAIDEQGSRLEDRLAVLHVEIAESDKVIEQAVEIPVVMYQPDNIDNGLYLGCQLYIQGNQVLKIALARSGQDGLNPFKPQPFGRSPGFVTLPSLVGQEGLLDFLPLTGIHGRGGAEQRHHHQVCQRGYRASPGRVHSILKRQGTASTDAGQGEALHLFPGCGQVLRRQDFIGGQRWVERLFSLGIIGRQAATGEIIIDLIFQPAENGSRIDGFIAKRQDGGIALGLRPPLGKRFSGLEKAVYFFLGDARQAAAIFFTAHAGHDFFNQLLGGLVISRMHRDNAISIEFGFMQQRTSIGNILNGDTFCFRLAQVGQQLLGGGQQLRAFRTAVIQGG